MNALKARRKYDAEQRELAWKARQAEEAAKVAAMTPEEREKYEDEKKARVNQALGFLAAAKAMGGEYSVL